MLFREGGQESSIYTERKKKPYPLSILYSTKSSFQNEGKIKTFSDIRDWKPLTSSMLTYQNFQAAPQADRTDSRTLPPQREVRTPANYKSKYARLFFF